MIQSYEVTIPSGSGRAGFLRALEAILKLPRVVDIHIDAKGLITCSRDLQEGDADLPLQLDFENLSPYGIIRGSVIKEVLVKEGDSPSTAVARMFNAATMDRLQPLAFVSGAASVVWKWFLPCVELAQPEEEEFFGLPIFRDRAVEDDVLFLCVGYQRGQQLVDTKRAYKILMG